MADTIEELVAEMESDGVDEMSIRTVKRAYMLGVSKRAGRELLDSSPVASPWDPPQDVQDVITTYWSDYLEVVPENNGGDRWQEALQLAINDHEFQGNHPVVMLSELYRRLNNRFEEERRAR